MLIENLINYSPYEFAKNEKLSFFLKGIKKLTSHHRKKCKKYNNILNVIKNKKSQLLNLADYPFLPTQIFKKLDLKSTNDDKIIKKLVSSGTSGFETSKIYLDRENAINQRKVLNKIMTTVIGSERLPMLIVDQPASMTEKNTFNARMAAIQGFSIFGRHHVYLLNDKNEIDYKALNQFLKKYSSSKFIIFGFTSVVFQSLINKLLLKKIIGSLKKGILIHGGGWKKLEKLKISNERFKKELFKKFLLKDIYNYYGLVEQTGSLFLESKKCGYFHTSIFSDIIIRDKNFNVLNYKKRGLIQLLSLLPSSYPGHNILTEDIGEIIGEDDCVCGLNGKYFTVHGRAKNSEIRGCSNI
tara:strand:- start:341 stop:1405 length:1065 start_codon:yes stop_codon:yes gene_type:complete